MADEKMNENIQAAVQHLLGAVQSQAWAGSVEPVGVAMYKAAQERHRLERAILNADREDAQYEAVKRNTEAHTAYFEKVTAENFVERQTIAMEKQAAAWESIAKSLQDIAGVMLTRGS